MKRNLMKEAHEMTREIIEKYGDVDYRTQLGLCLSFLAQKREQEMVKIEGKSEKQIKYAEHCRERELEYTQKKIDFLNKKVQRKGIQEEKMQIKTKTGILELTKTEMLKLKMQIISSLTKAWEILDVYNQDAETAIYLYYHKINK